jgi:hypothetical protein
MSGASIETALELWARTLRDTKARMRSLFTSNNDASSQPTSSLGRSGDAPIKLLHVAHA